MSYRHNWGEDRVYYVDAEGRLRAIPASWTSVASVDPFVAISAGRSLFRYEDLVKLADLLERIQK